MDLRLGPCLAEGRQVLARIAVEQQLVEDGLAHAPGITLVKREMTFRKRIRQIVRCKESVVAMIAGKGEESAMMIGCLWYTVR